MTPRTKEENERIREERRQQLLEAAVKVFTDRGFAATKIADIAAAAGISHGLVYHYFASKEEIYAALVDLAMGAALQTTEGALAGSGPPWERIAAMIRAMVMGAQYAPEYYALVNQAMTVSAVPAHIREKAWYDGERCRRAIEKLLAEGQAAGEVAPGDVERMTVMIYAFVQGLALLIISARQRGAEIGPIDAESVLRMLKA